MEQGEAILIRKQAWRDTSLLATWITPSRGKVSTMARSARKPGSPFGGVLDLFHTVEIGYAPAKRGDLHTLKEVRLLRPFQSPSTPNLFLAGYFAELVDLSTQDGHEAPGLYNLFSRAIGFLSSQPANRRALEFFETEMCRVLGILEEKATALRTIEHYCGRIPGSRNAVCSLLCRP